MQININFATRLVTGMFTQDRTMLRQHDCDDVLIVTLLYTISVEAAKRPTGTQLEHNNQVIFCKHKLLHHTLHCNLFQWRWGRRANLTV